MNMLISMNIASIRLIERTKDADRAKNKAYTEDIVQGIYTTEENTREAIKEIKHSDRRSAMSMISRAADQQSILPRNARKLIRSSVNKCFI
jgi:gamma-glutamyl phosphate reductase